MQHLFRRVRGERPMSHIFIGLVIAAGLETALLAACAGSGNDPKKVTRAFWTAMKEQNIAQAKVYATSEGAGTLQAQTAGGTQAFQFQLGVLRVRGQHAAVETVILNESNGNEFPIAIETSLVKENGTWKVDVNKTFGELYGTTFTAAAEETGREVAGDTP